MARMPPAASALPRRSTGSGATIRGWFIAGTPGRGAAVIKAKNGARALIVNAMGRVFMDPLDDPFAAVDRELMACGLGKDADAVIVDFHGEATSEKQAMGFFCVGRATLVVGTHTHVPTADLRILAGKRTGYVVRACVGNRSRLRVSQQGRCDPARRCVGTIAAGILGLVAPKLCAGAP